MPLGSRCGLHINSGYLGPETAACNIVRLSRWMSVIGNPVHQAIGLKSLRNTPLSNHGNRLQFNHILYIFIVVTRIALQFLHVPHMKLT